VKESSRMSVPNERSELRGYNDQYLMYNEIVCLIIFTLLVVQTILCTQDIAKTFKQEKRSITKDKVQNIQDQEAQ